MCCEFGVLLFWFKWINSPNVGKIDDTLGKISQRKL